MQSPSHIPLLVLDISLVLHLRLLTLFEALALPGSGGGVASGGWSWKGRV